MSRHRYHQQFLVSWDQLHCDARELCHRLIGTVCIKSYGIVES